MATRTRLSPLQRKIIQGEVRYEVISPKGSRTGHALKTDALAKVREVATASAGKIVAMDDHRPAAHMGVGVLRREFWWDGRYLRQLAW